MAYFNALGQGKVGWKSGVIAPTPVNVSSLWTSIYSVYNADAVGSTSLNTSLFAAYNGESNSNDSKGTNNGTVVGGLTYGDGKIGKGFTLNGSNSYVSLPNNSLNFTGDFSISLWVKFSDNSKPIVYIANTSVGGQYGYGWALLRNGSRLGFDIYQGDKYLQFYFPMNTVNNFWYHIVVTRKHSTVTKLYVNGVLGTGTAYGALGPVPTPYTSVNPVYGSTQICRFGVEGMAATFDAVNIWQKELTSTEVTELYNSGNGAQYITDSFYKPTTNDALNTYNGTAVGGLTYGVGKVGTAFQFNGSNAYVSMANNSMNLTGDFTIAFWLYHTASGAQTLISNLYYQATPTNIYKGWGLYIDNLSSSTNKLGFIIPRQTTDYLGFEFNTSLTLNAWNHVIITRVSGVDTYAWINNTLSTTTYNGPINSGNKIIDPSYHTTQRVSIGAQSGGGSPATFMSVNSKIDGLTIWNKQLTADERTQLYNSGNGKQYPN